MEYPISSYFTNFFLILTNHTAVAASAVTPYAQVAFTNTTITTTATITSSTTTTTAFIIPSTPRAIRYLPYNC